MALLAAAEAPVQQAQKWTQPLKAGHSTGAGQAAEGLQSGRSEAKDAGQAPYRPNGHLVYSSRHEKFMGSMRAHSEH